ncbi:hypothetical protein CY35_11G054900 [Sphagnum magellanicum]|nr:hypothetical protein CY35_11G054900 [Sphagnum magellanicum]
MSCWHFCSSCTKPGSFQCYMCPIAYCGGCVKEADFRMLRKRKGLCEECLPIVIMIECSQTVNSEGVEVDFEDKETYECLFKEYWLGLKNRLSLTLPELDKDGKLAKGICEDSENGGSDTENQDPSDVDGLGTESDRESDQDEDDSLDGKNQSRKKIKVAPTLSEDLVVENKADAFTEGAEDKEEEENEDEQEEEDEEDDDGDDDDAVSEVQSRKIEGWASKEVLDFIVHMKADPMKPLTRFAVNHLLWAYIKRHQLQDPEKKSQILCDERLQAMFGKKLMGQSEMYRQLNEHFPPKDSANGAKSLKELDRTVKDDARETDGTEDKLDRDMAKDRRRGRRRSDEKFERPDGNDFAAISPKNIGLIYLRRALLENLLDDPEFNSKVVDTFVKIRVPGSVSTLDTCYRLVLVTGTRQQTEFYKAGKKLTNVVLEILNLQKKEDLTIDLVSNQDFNEEECQRLRQSIKCGFIKTLTVGQLEAKAIALQEVKVNDWFESERQRLVNLRDRASEKGRKKELRECVEKLQELSNPTFRAAKLHARPEVSADPRMGPGYESDVSDEKPITDEFSSYRTKVSPGISWEKGSAVPSYNRLDSSNVEDSSFGGRKIDGDSHRYKPSSTRENNVGARDWSQKGYEAGRSSDRSFVRDINLMQEKSHWNEERGGGRSWTKDHRDYVQEQLSDQGGAEGSRATGKSRSDHWAGDSTGSKFVKDEFRTPLFDLPKVYPGGLQRESVGPAAAVLPLSNIGVTPLEPSVMKNQVALDMMEKEKVWHYQDPTGTVQGPFSMEQLRKWNTTGLFPIDLRIRRTGETHENSILLTSALAGKFTEERDPWTTTSTTTGFQSSTRDPVGGSSVSGLGEVKGSTWVGVRGTGDDRRWDTKRGEPDVPTRSTYSGTREWVEDHNAVEDRGSGWSRVRNSIYGSTPSASGRVDTRGPLRSRGDNDSWAPQLLAGGSRGQGLQDSGNGAGRSNWGRYSGRDSSNTGSWNDDSGSRDRSYLSERSSRLSKKDVPCKFHAQGYCKRGETCVFRHE